MPHPLSHYKPTDYLALFEQKQAVVERLFTDFSPPKAQIYYSEPSHFRMRAEFRIWHEGDTCNYVMFDPDLPKTPITIEHFPIASRAIDDLMPKLLACINENTVLKQKLFQIEFLNTTTGDMLVSLIYHRALDEQWQQAAKQLEQLLSIAIIGRSRKQKLVLSSEPVTEQFTVNKQPYTYQQLENSFTQPNAGVNQKMLQWAVDQASTHCQKNTDLLELYCGNGNFTLPLSKHFNQVLATEVAKSSIRSAQHNCAENAVSNINFVRLTSEETTEALNKTREFRRLANIDLSRYNFSTVFVDPPRAGLDTQTEALVSRFEHILYISCNPVTLAKNLQTLCKTHSIKAFALFDQFPYTDHCECGMLLEAIKSK